MNEKGSLMGNEVAKMKVRVGLNVEEETEKWVKRCLSVRRKQMVGEGDSFSSLTMAR